MVEIKRVGIFGGTFDPPHIGHLIIAQTVLCDMALDNVVFVPSGNPPHKIFDNVVDAKHRCLMTKLSIENNPKFDTSDIEVVCDEISYTAKTIQKFKKLYANSKLYFIVGADSLSQLKTWKMPEIIFENAELVAVKRTGISDDLFMHSKTELENLYDAKIHVVGMPLIEISSTDIRDRVKNLNSIKYMVRDEVERYIYEKKLYFNEGI